MSGGTVRAELWCHAYRRALAAERRKEGLAP